MDKSSEWTSIIKKSELIDAKDRLGKWCVAIINKIQDDNIDIHYDGQSSKLDRVNFYI